MFKTIKLKFLLFFAFFLVFLFSCFLAGGSVLAEEQTGAKKAVEGLDQTAVEGYAGGSNAKIEDVKQLKTSLPEIIGTIVGAGLAFIGVIFFILMIYGGFLWMTAQGNEQQVDKAKTLIISAVIGIIIVMAAYAITAYIGTTLTSQTG